MIVGLMYVFFCKVSVHILCLLLNGFVCFFLVNLFEFFVNSGYKSFVRWVDCKKFLPFCWLSIHSHDCFFYCAEAVEFDEVPFVYFGFVANAFGVLFMKSLPTPMSCTVLSRFPSRVFMVPCLMFKSLIHLELSLV